MLSIVLPLIFAFVMLCIIVYKFVTDSTSTPFGLGVGLIILTIGTVLLIQLLSSYGY